MTGDNGMTVRIAAVGDLHCPRTSGEDLAGLFRNLDDEADILLLCGDLTDYGKPEEAKQLVHHLSELRKMRVLAVLGNHEFESGQQAELAGILEAGGVTVLDG